MTIQSIFMGIFLAATLTAQATREHSVVLKNWPAPVYWQPAPAETESAGDKAGTVMRPLAATGSLVFVAITPCRVVDTRVSQMFAAPFGPPSLTPGPARSFPIQSGVCSIPTSAQAYSFNVTVVPPGPVGYLKIYPTGVAEPNAVTLDDLLGTIVNNAVIVPAGTPNGSVSAVVNGNTDLVMDINGYYVLPNPTVNTATGLNALFSNSGGIGNTADGYAALYGNTTGSNNTASGALALDNNTTGFDNTAVGYQALTSNTTGAENTAIGDGALALNTTGNNNTAVGISALGFNTTAFDNTAIGYGALLFNTDGAENTASGNKALSANTTGFGNTATGAVALVGNTTGGHNTATGASALDRNTTGGSNVATGYNALGVNTTGNNNIAIGENAALNITGSNNIDIGSRGDGGDSGTIRIGTPATHTSFFAQGVRGVTTGLGNAVAVMIDANGQLGTANSSRRFKEDIEDMNDASSGLLKLRPVTYRYQRPYADGSKPIDYGLIAEEVAEVYPDLVVKGADGQVETVQYQKLAPMLLNELQKQQAQIAELRKLVETLLSGPARVPITQ